jgi:flagellar hook protein FlgE
VGNSGLIAGGATTTLTLTTNLDSSETVLSYAAFDITDPATYNYSSSVEVFDSLGTPQLLTTYFIKTDVNTWSWGWSAEKDNGADPPDVMFGSFEDALVFNSNGILVNAAADPPTETIGTIPAGIAAGELSWDNGTLDIPIEITFDTTQFNSESVVISQNQNGFAAGNLTGVDIDNEGIVTASYSNGEQVKIAQLVLARFVNPGGLELKGKNLYVETTTSGTPRTGLPGPELGKIFTNSLEQSNVDMGSEFVRMITAQRGFQANSKIITTVDELLGELINLKR